LGKSWCECVPCNTCPCVKCFGGNGKCGVCEDCFIPCRTCGCCLGYGKCVRGCDCTVIGDIDGDGKIDAADVTLLRRYVAAENKGAFLDNNPKFSVIRARAAGRDNITALDVTLLRRYIAAVASGATPPKLGP